MILTDITGIKPFSHKIISVKCDAHISDKCVDIWQCKLSEIAVKRKRNNTIQDSCFYCCATTNKGGSKSHFYKYSKDDFYFSTIDSEDKAYFLGWIASDGHVRRKRFTIKILNYDSYILDNFSKYIKSNIPIHHKYYNDRMWGILDVSSMKMTKNLIKLLNINFGPKDFSVCLPQLSDKLTWCFLRGLFEGDGHIRKNSSKMKHPGITIGSVSTEMKKSIANFCAKFNINSCIPKDDRSIQFSGRYAVKFIEHIYKNVNPVLKLDRKYIECMVWKNNWTPKTKKLNLEIANEIRRLKNEGVRIKDLCIQFSVGRNAIYGIINNEYYKVGENK